MSNESHKIFLQAKNFTELKAIPFLREMIVLSFIMNTIRSSQRFLLMIDERPDGPAKKRDILFGLISTSSFVYEGIKTAAGIMKQLASSLPKELYSDVAWIINEENNSDSLFNTTLEKIRNGIAFHFNLQFGDDTLKQAVHVYPPVFEEGSSSITIDSAYSLADKVIAQIFSKYDSSSGTPEEKVVRLVPLLSQYTVKLCEVLDNVIATVISDYAKGFIGATATTKNDKQ